jgi:hypothetical protein
MNTPTAAEYEAYMLTLHEAEAEGARQEIVVGPYTAMLMIGALQLATRHPGASAFLRAELLAVVDQFRPWFVGTPGEHIIDRGNDPEFDQ